MAENTQINTVVTSSSKLVTDLNSSYYKDGMYSHARNITIDNAELGTRSNEPSLTFCFEFPGKLIGAIDLNNDSIVILSYTDTTSYIGIGSYETCTYETVVEDSCLGFKEGLILNGVGKKLFNNDTVITFGGRNYPTRRINLTDIPRQYELQDDSCKTKEYTPALDCDATLLSKKIDIPCIDLSRGFTGNLPNGTYGVTIAYSVKGEVFSDYFSPSQKIQIFQKVDKTSSINVNISGLDREFDSYQLVLISNIDGVKTNYVQGEYPTSQNNVQISDLGKTTVGTEVLTVRKNTWESAGIITSNSNYLLQGDLTSREPLNYQPQAMKIKARYVIKQVPLEYYQESPEEVGYWGDENYDYSIDWVYDTSEATSRSHIPGRKATSSDRVSPTGEDVYEWDDDIKPEKLENWQVTNTSSRPIPTNNPFVRNTRIAYRGEMGYYESTENYPDNSYLFGEDACTPIRYHKFPIVSRYENIGGKIYVNIKGVEFFNIEYPLDLEGNPVKGIKGYRIYRSDRSGGNRTVISSGLFSNVRKYTDTQNNREVMFSNYPYNDLSPDQYLSSTQTVFKNNREQNNSPLTEYYKDKFSYYSPHSQYNLKYRHGTEVKFLSEEVANVTGSFEPVYNHPENKLISNFGFWAAAAIGSIEAIIEASGATSKTSASSSTIKATLTDSGTIQESSTSFKPVSSLAVAGTSVAQLVTMIINAVKSGNVTSVKEIVDVVKNILLLIATAGIAVVLFTVSAMRYAQNIIDTIYNFLPNRQYAYQYNSHGFFNNTRDNKLGNIRRRTTRQPEYISPNLHTIDGTVYNNFSKEESVYIELNREIDDPITKDTSRRTVSGFDSCSDPQRQVVSQAVMYYGITKISNPNQYGQLGSTSQVLVSPCLHPVEYKENVTFSTPTLFGGDCIIARTTTLKKHPFFRQNLALEYGNQLGTNYPNGVEYNYNLYRNIAYPRYWIDTTKYDFSQFLNRKVVNFTRFSRTAVSKHNLDCKGGDKENIFSVDDAYFYLYCNGVIDFIAECDYNVSFREETEVPYYSTSNTNLSEIFKPVNIAKAEQFKLSKSYQDIYTSEVYSEMLSPRFDPLKDNRTRFPNAVIYSLPAFNLQNNDNWNYFLPNNFFSFSESDFGSLTGIHKLDQDRLIFLFSRSSPYISMGRDFLELEQSGRKISIGDGGLFAQDPREVQPTSNNYGACQSPFAFSSNQFGYFYPSEKQSRIFSFSSGLEDLLRAGNMSWGDMYMPIRLYKIFPDLPKEENPISGVGYLMSFHPKKEILYITKRDFIPTFPDIAYDKVAKSFMYQGEPVSLRDTKYFEDISWTWGYDLREKGFMSHYDWHPDWTIQCDNYFLSIKDNKVYKHDNKLTSFCNFYGKDYPFEIEPVFATGQNVEVLKSFELQLEARIYKNDDRDMFHQLNPSFDKLIVSNSEQVSPLLTIVQHPQDPRERKKYPKFNGSGYDILYTKEEQKIRFNMFWDSVRDRGEFTNNDFTLFINHPSGYKKIINPVAIDLQKPEKQRKKFRHYFQKVWLSKEFSGTTQYIIKLIQTKNTNSIR